MSNLLFRFGLLLTNLVLPSHHNGPAPFTGELHVKNLIEIVNFLIRCKNHNYDMLNFLRLDYRLRFDLQPYTCPFRQMWQYTAH